MTQRTTGNGHPPVDEASESPSPAVSLPPQERSAAGDESGREGLADEAALPTTSDPVHGDDDEHGAARSPSSDDEDEASLLDEELGGRTPTREELQARSRTLVCESFEDLQLQPTLAEAIAKIGWTSPTPVQKLCLPYTLAGRDVAGFAQTGTGKTGVFLISISHKLLTGEPASAANPHPRAIVLAPTRELAMQIEDDAQGLLRGVGLSSLAVFGGIDYDKQAKRLQEGVDVIVATPGRLMDYIKKGLVQLDKLSLFVCDEADRMFDMGFIEDVEFFLKRIPENCQKLLFSATTNEQVKELAFEYLETPEYISVNPETITPEKIEQHAIHVHAKHKLKVMLGLLKEQAPTRSIIFTNTKLTAEWLYFKLAGNGIDVDLITGDLPQKKRIMLIERIKEGKLKALIATDVASRGLHISKVSHVYNFDLPDDASNYVHRIGRTARAGERGQAYSLVCDDYGHNLADINALLGPTLAMQSQWYNEAFLAIEDKAGNPFEKGLGRRGPRHDEAAPSRDGKERHERPERPERGPRRERGRGGQDQERGARPGRGGEARDQELRHQPARNGGDGPHEGERALDDEAKKKRRRKRRRGKGGEGGDQVQQPSQQGGAAGGRQQGGRAPRGEGESRQGRHRGQNERRPRHDDRALAVQASETSASPASTKGFFGVIKKFFRTMFGGGKK